MVNRYEEAYQRYSTSWEAMQEGEKIDFFSKSDRSGLLEDLCSWVKHTVDECERDYQPVNQQAYEKLNRLYDTLMYAQFPYRYIRDRRWMEPQDLNLRQIESTEKYPALMENGYKRIQYVRGDGNCFYRAAYMHFVNQCLHHPTMAQQFMAALRAMSTQESNGVMDTLQHWNANDAFSFNNLVATNQNFDLAMVTIFRRFTANYILNHTEMHAFIPEGVELFCQEVLTLGKDGRETAIPALAEALGIKVTVALMDDHGNFTFDTFGHGEEVSVFLHGGHYDILIKD